MRRAACNSFVTAKNKIRFGKNRFENWLQLRWFLAKISGFLSKKALFPRRNRFEYSFFCVQGIYLLIFLCYPKKPSRFFLSEEKRDLFVNSRARENSLAQT
jgi:hypothetical protein